MLFMNQCQLVQGEVTSTAQAPLGIAQFDVVTSLQSMREYALMASGIWAEADQAKTEGCMMRPFLFVDTAGHAHPLGLLTSGHRDARRP